MRLWLAIILPVMVLGCAERNVILERQASTVLVVGSYGMGSGFAVAPNIIATAAHVVECNILYVETAEGVQHPVVRSWRSEDSDVGFLEVRGTFPVVPVGPRPELMDRVYLISCILGDDFPHSVTEGRVSYVGRDWYGWWDSLQVDVTGAPGSSGGLLMDTQGRIVGMCVGGVDTGIVVFEPIEHIMEAYQECLSKWNAD